ncbi:enhancer of mRNA-decapping protein 3 [Fopius arisanus]|uniref:Enhancer of mRNA-decapping protein 3 n=1 Tax=Fopius arisanus TaxID=64838 RepID=A0A9R1TVV7_9HYME|nr:PREDICTED: enhancer of mRNA-decapping protein 3-like [Fopius arisanus]XP_011299817.1 PREDICTED: enhancer of mRNA-decapping protein 3-like [Fopius arisanus]XP_011299818.1 PREDICTED: enhancer of mRNA-decapping protein 3-like [Fopius arisanus]XP_011299819.1 PREDICTED: enhancer of mRNA-decapping protein 3-like [Fopius arisanus]
MSEQFVGCMVSIKCVDDLGTYQGQISDLNRETVTISKAFRDGVPYPSSQVIINAKDIENLEIISTEEAGAREVQSSKVKRPIAKRANRSVSECIPTSVPSATWYSKKVTDPIPIPEVTNGKTTIEANVKGNQRRSQRQKWQERDEQAFGTPIDQSLSQDFDFEKNLALFNKEAVWQEINSSKPDVLRQSENNRGTYRHDENILVSKPTTLRQIVVPLSHEREYVTDDGLVIPSITLELHRQLMGAADRLGISWERRVELLGRAGAEIILQLLGGAHRLNPKNAHQWPTVVALCGPHRSGAAGVNCARQLSSHGVETVVYIENSENISLLQELSLYKMTGNKVVTGIDKLAPVVDLIVVALCEEDSPRVVPSVAKWVKRNRAPVLAIEPPSAGTPGISSKFSLLGALPLSHSPDNGRLYLCNLALPSKVFSDVGITYKSPFGPKSVIPLHSDDS